MIPELHPGMKEFNRIFKECNHIYHDIALKLKLSDSGFDILYILYTRRRLPSEGYL